MFLIWGRKRLSIGTKGNQQLFLFLVCNKIFFDKRNVLALLSVNVWVPEGYSGTLTLQKRIWNEHGLFPPCLLFPVLPVIHLKPQKARDAAFGSPFGICVCRSAKQRDGDHGAAAALGLPRWFFGFAAGRAGAAADELLKLEQLLLPFVALSARTFNSNPPSPCLSPGGPANSGLRWCLL